MSVSKKDKPRLKVYQHYTRGNGTYRIKKSLGSFSLDGKCAYIVYDYSPLRKTMLEMGIKTMAELQRLTGISENRSADISKGRPVALDTIAVLCYGLQCKISDIIKFRFVEASVIDIVNTGVPQKFGPEMLIDFEKKEMERAVKRAKEEAIKPKNILFDD